jgi:hypothetical protein
MTETHWKPIEHAPKDGKPLLLWARLKSSRPELDDFFPVVGIWHLQIMTWMGHPQHLRGDELRPTHWAELPAPPSTQEAGQ